LSRCSWTIRTGAFCSSGETIINHGDENNSSRSPNEAVDDVLDDVSLHFIAPYRW